MRSTHLGRTVLLGGVAALLLAIVAVSAIGIGVDARFQVLLPLSVTDAG